MPNKSKTAKGGKKTKENIPTLVELGEGIDIILRFYKYYYPKWEVEIKVSRKS